MCTVKLWGRQVIWYKDSPLIDFCPWSDHWQSEAQRFQRLNLHLYIELASGMFSARIALVSLGDLACDVDEFIVITLHALHTKAS